MSTPSSIGCPGLAWLRAETRAIHSDLPPTSADAASSASSPVSAALVRLACSTGGASIVKITWISVPSSSVMPVVTRMVPH